MAKTNPITEFLEDIDKTSTRRIYRNHINSFFDTLKLNPDTYFDDGRDYSEDLLSFWKEIKHLAPITRAGRITCVRQFLEENDIQIQKKVWKKIKRQKKAIPKTIDHVPTPTELKQILQHGGIKERALFLVMSSSGLRIGEVLNLKPQDVVYKDNNGNLISPGKIIIRQDVSKNDVPRITFFSDESRDALIEWLKVREDYLKAAVERCDKRKNFHKDLNDDRIFPFAWSSAWNMWAKLLKKSGYDKKDPTSNRFEIHIHCLRKYFMNRLKGVIRADAVEQMSGHEGYLDRSYRRIPEDDLSTLYKQGMHSLLVFEHPIDISDVHEQLKEKDKQLSNLQQEVHNLRNQLGEFQSLVEDPEFRMKMMNMMAEEWEKLKREKKKEIGF